MTHLIKFVYTTVYPTVSTIFFYRDREYIKQDLNGSTSSKNKKHGDMIICDVIKQNESELEKNKISVFIFTVSFNFRPM